jgi:hypothetical protein
VVVVVLAELGDADEAVVVIPPRAGVPAGFTETEDVEGAKVVVVGTTDRLAVEVDKGVVLGVPVPLPVDRDDETGVMPGHALANAVAGVTEGFVALGLSGPGSWYRQPST